MADPQPTRRRRLGLRLRRKQRTTTPRPALRVPWWATAFTDAGRPIVAVLVMVMCAPGEHHLGVLAGWDDRLAWGMASVLAAYAGIAAVVASRRPKGAPGKTSAVVGAWLSLGAAMAAQPVSHLFVTGHWSAEPHAPAWLVVTVSCVPPLVLGHLLHLAATPVPKEAPAPVVPAAPVVEAPAVTVERAEVPVPPKPEQAPPAVEPAAYNALPAHPFTPPAEEQPAPEEQRPPRPAIVYRDPRCAAVRPLYDNGTRPGTAAMRDALIAAGHGRVGDSTIRGTIRAEIEEHEPELADYPPAIGRTA
jgi:outer membrane biosynthesis protein TonB